MIQNFGGGELLVILILALVVLGPERIPEMAKSAGKMIAKFKSMSSGLQGQVQGVMDDPAMQPLRELGDFAARPRQKLAEYALEAEADERAKAEKAAADAAKDDAEMDDAEVNTSETETADPDAVKPVETEPDTDKPVATKPDSTEPDTTGPDTTGPASTDSDDSERHIAASIVAVDEPPPVPVPKPNDGPASAVDAADDAEGEPEADQVVSSDATVATVTPVAPVTTTTPTAERETA